MISKTNRLLAAATVVGGLLASSGAALATTTDFVYTGAIETWTATASGDYRVTAIGAQGASATSAFVGGRGAQIAGTFTFSAGDMFQILVGGVGTASGVGTGSGGGGGGSFFVSLLDAPLLIAGGGGGTRSAALQDGTDASITEQAFAGSQSSSTYVPAFSGTAPGQGGAVGSNSWGSGGAGFFGDGQGDPFNGTGGLSWANGMLGGTSIGSCVPSGAIGGFGGGGSGNGCWGGGGGGGYTGGDGGFIAGGGGSFNSGVNLFALAGVGIGDGALSIEFLDGPPIVPLPAGLPLLLTGLGLLGLKARRRKV